MATLRTVLNNVLTVLGEDEIGAGVSELTESYHKTLLVFFNQIKQTVEDAHNWRALRSSTVGTNTASSSTVTFSTGTNSRSRIIRWYNEVAGEEIPLVFDKTESTNPYRLIELDTPAVIYRQQLDTTSGDEPRYFYPSVDSAGNFRLSVYPVPPTVRSITALLTTPQEDFTTTDLDTFIKVPPRPIEVGVLWYALEERGEELGTQGTFNGELFNDLLGSAIARDAAEQGEYNLVPV